MSVFKPIDGFNVLVTPFYAHKRWNLNYLDTANPYPYNVSNVASASIYDGIYYRDKFLTASLEPTTEHNKLKRSIWDSINHLYYDNFYLDPYGKWIQGDIPTETRKIYNSVKVLSIPTKYVGEGIKRNTLRLTISNSVYIDDGHGNVVIANSSSYFVPTKDIIQYSFNDAFKVSNTTCSKYTIQEDSKFRINAIANNVVFTSSLYPIVGQSAIFDANLTSSIRTVHHDKLHFTVNHDYSVVTNLTFPTSQVDLSGDTNIIITKNGKVKKELLVYGNSGNTVEYHAHTAKYPFAIEVYNQNTSDFMKIKASLSDGNTLVTVTSSAALTTGVSNNIALIKTGSNLQLYINGALSNTAIIPDNVIDIGNESMLFMGTRGDGKYKLNGIMDYALVYDRGILSSELTLIKNSYKKTYYQTGNVLYKQGLVILTEPKSNDAGDYVYTLTSSLVSGDNNYHTYFGSISANGTPITNLNFANSNAYPAYETDICMFGRQPVIIGYSNVLVAADSASFVDSLGTEVYTLTSGSVMYIAKYTSEIMDSIEWIKYITGSRPAAGSNFRLSRITSNKMSSNPDSLYVAGRGMVTTSFADLGGPAIVTASAADCQVFILKVDATTGNYVNHINLGNGSGFTKLSAESISYYSSSLEGIYGVITSDFIIDIPMSASLHKSSYDGIIVNYSPELIMRSASLPGQPANYNWPQQITGGSGPSAALIGCTAIPGNEGVYVIGRNNTNVTVPAATSGGLMDSSKFILFTAKYGRDGSLQWMVQSNDDTNIVGAGTDRKSYQYLNADVTADANGDCYVISSRTGSVSFTGSSTAITKQTSGDGRDIFVHKYNTSGVLQWVQQYSGSGGSWSNFDDAASIKMSISGCFYIAGAVSNATASIPKAGGGTFELYRGATELGIGFIAKCTGSDGTAIWVSRIPCYIDSTALYFGTLLRHPSLDTYDNYSNGGMVGVTSNYTGSGLVPSSSREFVQWVPYPWNAEYKSTKKITQYEILCTVGPDELNATQNPTIVDTTDTKRYIAKPFVTGSEFSPYTTTIGLYNEFGDLLAVGKLAKPVKRNQNMDTTYVVRFDLF